MRLTNLATAFALMELASAKCNPESDLSSLSIFKDLGNDSSHVANLTFLPHDLSDPESPACLDGSPYGFYFVPSTTGSEKWTISINGGGWCYDEIDCYCRSKTSLGTSTVLPAQQACSCLNPNEDGSMDTDCNCLHLPYSDGASFSGFRANAWPVPEDPATGVPANSKIYFRGIKNFDGVLDFAMAHGMGDAAELVVTGGSAGGLSTFLHSDRAAARVPKAKVRAAPVVGFFLDVDNFKHTNGNESGHGGPNTLEWVMPGTGANYTTWMEYIYTMQNLTFGVDGGLTKACEASFPDEPHLCFMSPHMSQFIETPLFMFNSRFDAWQLANEFQSHWNTAEEQAGVIKYGTTFLQELSALRKVNDKNKKHGGMITTCICHGCPWADLELDNKSSYEHYADWFYGKVSGDAAFHIDYRNPNGNGTLSEKCSPFP